LRLAILPLVLVRGGNRGYRDCLLLRLRLVIGGLLQRNLGRVQRRRLQRLVQRHVQILRPVLWLLLHGLNFALGLVGVARLIQGVRWLGFRLRPHQQQLLIV
jgi:hypothetical protein